MNDANTRSGHWMIYGANGYTGRLIAAEAVQRGLRPILAGRNAAELEALGGELGLPWRAFVLDRPEALRSGLAGVDLVLHCAGPFSATSAPMLDACIATGVHYLDITGEIDVFAHCHARDAEARDAGVLVMPGVGFDVVPTDCLAARLKQELPDASSLVLAFEAGGGPSPGTARTSVEGLAGGGRIRRGGRLQRVPLGWKARRFERDGESRTAVTIPWGDVFTAWVSTGIPDIEVYMAVPPATVKQLRRLRLLGPLLGLRPIQSWLKRRVDKRVHGPDDARRRDSCTHVWGEARNPTGLEIGHLLRMPNGYAITVTASLGIVGHLLAQPPPPGFHTPSQLMGAGYVMSLPGVAELR